MELYNSFNTSVKKAFEDVDPNWESYVGMVVCGTHTPQEILLDSLVEQIRKHRVEKIPFLGICAGLQMAVVEYARNVLEIPGATTAELEPDSANAVIIKLPKLRVGIKDVGGRLESHWHHYCVEPSLIPLLQRDFDGVYSHDGILEELAIPQQGYFAVQYHPEYQSSKDNPHPIIEKFLDYAKKYTTEVAM